MNQIVFFKCVERVVPVPKDIPSVYSVEDVWVALQTEITFLLAVQLQAVLPGSMTSSSHGSMDHSNSPDKQVVGMYICMYVLLLYRRSLWPPLPRANS